MPLSELHLAVAKGKPESLQRKMTNCLSDLPYMHDEFVELFWDNGPVALNNIRPRKTSTSLYNAFDCKDNPFPKIGHFKATEPKTNNFPVSGINAQDDEIVPWINYSTDDPLHHGYCSDFLNEFSVHSHNNNTVPLVRSSFLDHAVRDSHNVEQRQHASETNKPREIDVSISGSSTNKAHKESGGNGVISFSHFSRPRALAKANLQHAERLEESNNNKVNFAISSNTLGSASGVKSVLGNQDLVSLVEPNGEMGSLVDKSKANLCEEDISSKNSNHINTANTSPERIQSSSFAPSAAIGRLETTDKGNGATVASSSVCSGSGDHKYKKKRKHIDSEESGYQSEEFEDESMDVKKPSTTQGKGKKRSRAAEVHNLSERRRRDRINERMRALQELVPNCNKIDKASMLDEAIEYLKSLQMQVQIMSMGSGFCMPPIMMQHMRPLTMAHFSPMGMGMDMALNYGMGLYDMNGSFIPVSPIQKPQFPCPSVSGSPVLQRVSRPQMFGIAGQGFPMPMPYRQPFASLRDTATKPEDRHQHSKSLEKM